MELRIRRMTIEDLDRVMEIEKESFSVPWSRDSYESEISRNILSLYLVMEGEGQIIGYCGMWFILDEAHITNIAVQKSSRGEGVGTRLVECLMEEAFKKGVRNLTLEVREGNIAARKLYEKMGFVVEGRRPGYYPDNHEDAIIMWKREEEQ
ncbi:MAG TPA: ribosomal protein S18-alanine N-acetyltransferase [Clostridia bacterium]|nr:ribosomal protein S18-alanine N-acetyltransferase [Clostridia bacterium]